MEDLVEDDYQDGGRGEGLGEEGLQEMGHPLEDVGDQPRSQTEDERNSHGEDFALVELLGEHLLQAGADHERDGEDQSGADHRGGDQGDSLGKFRGKAQEGEDDPGADRDPAADGPGSRGQTHVAGRGIHRHRPDRAGHGRGKAVGKEALADRLHI